MDHYNERALELERKFILALDRALELGESVREARPTRQNSIAITDAEAARLRACSDYDRKRGVSSPHVGGS